MNISTALRRERKSHVTEHFGDPSLTHPVSQACTQAQMAEPAYAYWCKRIHESPKMHRKQWEFCYILQALSRHGAMSPGLRGLGFGVGEEPLTALFAAHGIEVTATDLEPERAFEKGWTETDQHAHSKDMLNARGICDPQAFHRLVNFRHTDMNAIDADLQGYDFCWSACALEHLGSIKHGLKFIENSLDCLKPGGIAVHTTELNCGSDRDTIDHAETVLFRRRDIMALAQKLTRAGHHLTVNFSLGDQPLDHHIDVPPYSHDTHLKLELSGHVTTSFGILVRKGTQEKPTSRLKQIIVRNLNIPSQRGLSQ